MDKDSRQAGAGNQLTEGVPWQASGLPSGSVVTAVKDGAVIAEGRLEDDLPRPESEGTRTSRLRWDHDA